jgi:hypothetical protein
MLLLLTLDQSTLFYWTLSDIASHKKRKHASAIKDWALAVPTTAKPTLKAPSRASLAKSGVPPLTTGTSRSSALSVLTDNVKIINRRALDSVKVKVELPSLLLHIDGGLSDNNKRRGEEWEAAINSPPKGKKQVTSEVSLL